MNVTNRAWFDGSMGRTASVAVATDGPKAADVPKATGPLPVLSPIALLLSRIGFGAREAEFVAASTAGYDAWLEYQLADDRIDDSALEAQLTAALPTLSQSSAEILRDARNGGRIMQAVDELRAATIVRQLYSPRQLYEVMVDFWTNHFSMLHVDGAVRYFKTADDREVIRQHAMGSFADLLHGSARSPAMLYSLDNYSNVAGGPNENYARELMELHTLGVNGGYTEADVKAVARCFTGWTFAGGNGQGEVRFVFVAGSHDTGAKTVLGRAIAAGGGVEEGDAVLDQLIDHPSTARFIATKLVRRFVTDAPPVTLVDRVAASFTATRGDVRTMLRTVFQSDEFKASADQKTRRPMEYVIALLRTANATLTGDYLRTIAETLNTMGQLHYMWPAPNGYPDVAGAWVNTSSALSRWNFAFAAAENTLRGTIRIDVSALIDGAYAMSAASLVDRLATRLLRRPLAAADRDALIALAGSGVGVLRPMRGTVLMRRATELTAVLLGSAYFTYR